MTTQLQLINIVVVVVVVVIIIIIIPPLVPCAFMEWTGTALHFEHCKKLKVDHVRS